ncbi:MAG: type II toxin-antitoxin system VapC family toxin [Planctomycetes bacterium]|nr:type II toxin-antitoxin system VapC family toxin [Planctomycetota bacterium]
MILLDTHAWLWWNASPERLSSRAKKAIEAAPAVAVAAISMWEVAMLSSRGRVVLDRPAREWLQVALAQDRVTLLPLTPEIACLATELAIHGDPADRIILATARIHRARLVTKDEALRTAQDSAIW